MMSLLKDVSDFESLAELKADIREKLEEESTHRTKKNWRIRY